MSDPTVSIVMPAFNSGRYVLYAVQSVQAQTLRDWELLVVDGGSRDNTVDIVRGLAANDPRIVLLPNPDDQGPAHARSVGIRAARGKFVAFLDADDMWLPHKLEAQVDFMQKGQLRFTYTRYRLMSANGFSVGCVVPMRNRFDFAAILRHRGIGALTVMLDRELLTDDVITTWRRAGGEDSLWWFLILRKGETAHLLDEDLARYRNTAGSLSKNQLLTLRTVWGMYRTELSLPLHRAGWDYLSYFLDAAQRKCRLRACAAISRIAKRAIG